MKKKVLWEAFLGLLVLACSISSIILISQDQSKPKVDEWKHIDFALKEPEPIIPVEETTLEEETLADRVQILEESLKTLSLIMDKNSRHSNNIDKKYHQGSGNDYDYYNK